MTDKIVKRWYGAVVGTLWLVNWVIGGLLVSKGTVGWVLGVGGWSKWTIGSFLVVGCWVGGIGREHL